MAKAKPHETGCKVCGKTDDRLRRGLCPTHYMRFTRKRATLTGAEAEAFEAKCIAEGWLEEKQQGGRPKQEDPFDDMLREVREEFRVDIAAAVAKDQAEQAQQDALETARRAKKTTKRKAN